MKLLVTGRQVTVTDAIRQDIDRKVARLGRVLGESAVRAQCVLARERGQFVVELTVHARGDHALHGLGRHASLPAAVTAAAEKVSHQAQRLSDRWKTRRKADRQRRADGGLSAAPVLDGTPADRPAARIIRAKHSPMRPMSLDDAALALSAGERPFLVFRHDASNAVAVLYRRPDGHFGLIEPEA